MASYKADDIRTVALVGHEQAGKTSLADALLFKAKATDRRGSVDDGTSVSDFDEEEKKHKYSIDSSVLHLDYQGKRVYLIDTPGKPDFVGQALGGLNPVDTAVVVISATSGIQVNTRRMFNEAGRRSLARIDSRSTSRMRTWLAGTKSFTEPRGFSGKASPVSSSR